MFPEPTPWPTDTGRVPPWIAARNMLLDPVFYDVAGLSMAECAEIVRASAAGAYHEGGMLLAWPAAAGRPIEYHDLSARLCAALPGLDAVAVPGVGSSPLGAAAFARQVADAIGRPVAGVIAGQGLADVVSEALGGWFDFGVRNRVLAAMRLWRRSLGFDREATAEELREEWDLASATGALDEPDVNTVLNLMLRQGRRLSLLAAHSKGALVVQNACIAFERENALDAGVFDHVRIVTFGCGVALPAAFTRVFQYVGTWDALGRLNTPLSLEAGGDVEWVEAKGHNLVRANPIHMPVEEKLPPLTPPPGQVAAPRGAGI